MLRLHSKCQKMFLGPQAAQTPRTIPWACLSLGPLDCQLQMLPCFTFSFFWFDLSETIMSFASMRKLELTKRHQLHFLRSFWCSYLLSCLLSFALLGGGMRFWSWTACFLALCWCSIKHEKNYFTETFLLYALIPGGDRGAARSWHTSAPLNIS